MYKARKRRHKINKILIILDCLIESVVNLCMIMVYLIPSNNLLFQHISFSFLVMMYSVPIPMSYLLNEKRVKDVIIQKGWIAAIKAIFYSTEKIRKLETDRFLYSSKSSAKVVKLETTLSLEGKEGNAVHTTISEARAMLPSSSCRQVNYILLLLMPKYIKNII